MELPSPPTDNIYKFLALTGAAIVLASITSPIWLYRQVEEFRAGYTKDIKIVNIEAREWQQLATEMDRATVKSDAAHKRLEESVNILVNSKKILVGELGRAEQSLEDADKARKEVSETIKALRQKTIEWDKKNAELDYKKNLLDIMESRARSTKALSYFGLIFGIALSGIGFTLWYKRTQKHEDVALRKKAASSNEEDK